VRQVSAKLQGFISCGVTEAVIDRLEVIDVDHQHRQRTLVALETAPFLVGEREKMAAVDEAGQRVGGRELLEPFGLLRSDR
jgi:hypothetical protein